MWAEEVEVKEEERGEEVGDEGEGVPFCSLSVFQSWNWGTV